jgi:hypothetical protein
MWCDCAGHGIVILEFIFEPSTSARAWLGFQKSKQPACQGLVQEEWTRWNLETALRRLQLLILGSRRGPRDPSQAKPSPRRNRTEQAVVAGGEGKPATPSRGANREECAVGWEGAVWASAPLLGGLLPHQSPCPRGPTSHAGQPPRLGKRGPHKVTRSGVRAGRRSPVSRAGMCGCRCIGTPGRITPRPETSLTFGHRRARAVGSSVCSAAPSPSLRLLSSFGCGEFSFG